MSTDTIHLSLWDDRAGAEGFVQRVVARDPEHVQAEVLDLLGVPRPVVRVTGPAQAIALMRAAATEAGCLYMPIPDDAWQEPS